jgi:acyl-CoA dehydrogenase
MRANISRRVRVQACHTAMLTLGGMGYARMSRRTLFARIPDPVAPSPHMITNFLAGKVLGLPKSY